MHVQTGGSCMSFNTTPQKTLGWLFWWKNIEQKGTFILQKHRVGPPIWPYRYRVVSRMNRTEMCRSNDYDEIKSDWAVLTDEAGSSSALDKLLAYKNMSLINSYYEEDFFRTIEEMKLCYRQRCFIAVMALGGKAVEIVLKLQLSEAGLTVDPYWTIGKLIGKIDEVPLDQRPYLHPRIKSIANIVNASRITAIHAKEQIPVPSEDEANITILAIADIINRYLTNKMADSDHVRQKTVDVPSLRSTDSTCLIIE